MKNWMLMASCALFIMSACRSNKKVVYGPEQKKRVQEVRQARQDKNSIEGHWQEYKRTKTSYRKAAQELPFTDTLKVLLFADSTAHLYLPYGKIIAGKLQQTKTGVLLHPNYTYDKFVHGNGQLQFIKENLITYLYKTDGFYQEPVIKKIPCIELGNIKMLNASFLAGKWKVYKKEDPVFDRKKIYLHSIDIGEQQSDYQYAAKARYNDNDKLISDEGSIEIKGAVFILKVMNQQKNYKILKAEGDELLLQDGSVVYFLKNLGR